MNEPDDRARFVIDLLEAGDLLANYITQVEDLFGFGDLDPKTGDITFDRDLLDYWNEKRRLLAEAFAL